MADFNEARKIALHLKKFEAQILDSVNAMGVIGVNQFKGNFVKQGFEDETVQPWKPRKRSDRGRYAARSGNRGILIKSGALRRSLVYRKQGKYAVKFSSNLPYAPVHNNGLRSGRGKGFIMPKRQFVGNSATLNRKVLFKINSNITKIFK